MTAINIITEDLKVLVFRSNIDDEQKEVLVRSELLRLNGISRVDIDLEDIDNVLRVECHLDCRPELIEEVLAKVGFNCAELSYKFFLT